MGKEFVKGRLVEWLVYCGFEWVEEKKLWVRKVWLRVGGVEGFWVFLFSINKVIVRYINLFRLVGNFLEFEKLDKGFLLFFR